jgi:hypothetical protein
MSDHAQPALATPTTSRARTITSKMTTNVFLFMYHLALYKKWPGAVKEAKPAPDLAGRRGRPVGR